MTRLLKRLRLFFLKRYIRKLQAQRQQLCRTAQANPAIRFHVAYVEAMAGVDRTLDEFHAKAWELERQQ